NSADLTLPVLPDGVVVSFHKQLDGRHEPNNFFLAYLAPASYRIRMRRSIQISCMDQVLPAEEKPRALRVQNAFPSAECHQIVAHVDVGAEILCRRNICCGIDQAWNPLLSGDFGKRLAFYLALWIC